MILRLKYSVVFFIAALFSVHAQMLNITLEDNVEPSGVLPHAERSLDEQIVSELSPYISSLKKTPFSTIHEFYEDSPRGGLTISSDVETYRDVKSIAANNKSNYVHKESNTIFPHRIGNFERVQLVVFKEQPLKIHALYKAVQGESTFTVSLTPSTEATEGRLRNEFLTHIRQLSKEKGKAYTPTPTFLKFNGIRYVNNGIEGTYVNDEKSFSQVNVFECGSWMLVTKLDVVGMDEASFRDFSEDLIRYFNPAKLTALKPMNLKPIVDFEREALQDTVVTGAMVASAFKKIDWATDNVSIKERYSGFPDIYLDMHTESLKAYLEVLDRKKTRSAIEENSRFYTDLKSINDAGYLDEFVMETYENVMIVPAYLYLDFNGYTHWKQARELQVDLLKKRYKINYRALPY